jgi:salicylate hydroxylase
MIVLPVIGCDGIKSRVRQLLFGKTNPASHAHYTHKVAYRALVPMADAITAIGEYKAKNQHMHVGPGAHVLHFPVAGQTLMNVAAFVADPEEWKADAMVAPGSRTAVEAAFDGWGPTVRNIISLLPSELERWAVFDSFDHPAPFFSQGRICIAGDAAHASSPHHGAGAGIGIEDALCLSTLLGIAADLKLKQPADTQELISLALNTFNDVRRERGHWIVASSRYICDVYEWADPATKGDPDKCFDEIHWRSHKIWYFDYHGMLAQAIGGYAKRLRVEQIVSPASSGRPSPVRRRSEESVW